MNRSSDALIPATKGELCLDFANTLSWRGSGSPADEFTTPDRLLAWCAAQGTLQAGGIELLRDEWRRKPLSGTAALAKAIALREAIYRIFSAVAADEKPAAKDLDLLNRALAGGPSRAELRLTEEGYLWRVRKLKRSVPAALAPVLWSAGDLLAGGKLDRIRRCANDKCLWLFFDASKAGARRWCSMASCGNRAKAHRHYAKTRQA